jgi:hypothetical protein
MQQPLPTISVNANTKVRHRPGDGLTLRCIVCFEAGKMREAHYPEFWR